MIMKNKLLNLLGIAILISGCSSDIDGLDNEITSSAPMIKLDGSISQQYITRVDDGGFCDGDQIGLYGVNYTNNNTSQGTLLDKGNQVDNARYTYDGTKWSSTAPIYYKDAKTNIDLFAYYPYGSPSNVNAYDFKVHFDQSGLGVTDGYAMSDFLWGMTPNIVPSNEVVKIRFSHRLSCANVILHKGDNFTDEEFEALQKSVLVSNTKHNATINLSTGEAVATGEVSSEGIVMRATEGGFRAIVVPQTVAEGKSLFTITLDGITYNFKYSEDSTPKPFTFAAGKQSKFDIYLNKKGMNGSIELELKNCEIVDWIADLETHGGEARQYYVVHLDEAGTLGAKIRAEKKNPNKIRNLKVSGNINAEDFYFMRDSMEILTAVNLKESKIISAWTAWLDIGDGTGFQEVLFKGDMPTSEEGLIQAFRNIYPDANDLSYHSASQKYPANEIPPKAFCEKHSFAYFSFPEKVTKIGIDAFARTLLSGALVIPNDVVEIGAGAFTNTKITSLELSHNLRIIGSESDGGVFEGCSTLSGNLVLPETLESISKDSFKGCSMLSGTLIIPPKIKEIPWMCFTYCNFDSIVIPEGVTHIGYAAFWDVPFRGQLILPSSLKVLDTWAFMGCDFQGELVIPYQVQSIGESCFAGNNFSSIVFAENSELTNIANEAFSGNNRLVDPIIFPKGLSTIGTNAFGGCSMPAITLPSTVSAIGSNAFADCFNITAITCDAVLPPTLGNDVFNGVAKDNFTVKVPEESLTRYQTANGWRDFMRIAAKYDFSISRSQMRTLNASHSKEYTLRAPTGETWSVTAPSWVTVSPSSGVGKQNVTITVSEMARTDDTFNVVSGPYNNQTTTQYKGRSGEIVFQLDNKLLSDNETHPTTKMTVEQYDSDQYDGEAITNYTHNTGSGVNIVFMGDCFDAQDIASGKYIAAINEAIGYYFGIEPYKSYKEYFNVYTIVGMSADSGMGTVNTVKEAKFGSQYSLEGIEPNTETTFEYAMKAGSVNEDNINKTLVVMVENTTDYGGICYMWGDGSAIAICPMSRDAAPFDFRGIVQHEAGGHGFAKLADEYIYTNAFIESCSCGHPHLDSFNEGKARGWYRNLSTNGDMKSVEWSHLIFHKDYSNIVDMYEGGYFHTRGIYRSEATSCMNNNISYYSAIQRQEMVERIMKYAGEEFNINDFYSKDVRDASNNTRATAINCVEVSNSNKQMPPKYMGDKPNLK